MSNVDDDIPQRMTSDTNDAKRTADPIAAIDIQQN